MSAKLVTANGVASELGVPTMRITRAVHRHLITPDYTAGRIFLFRPRRVPAIRAAIGLPAPTL